MHTLPAALLDSALRLTVLSGAGISTASGIPDYRDAEGRWKRPQPVQYRDFRVSAALRRRYWARSLLGWPRFAAASPNPAHRALAELERQERVAGIITQNVDGLHQQAGSRSVIDLHGRLDRIVCLDCGAGLPRADFQRILLRDNPGFDAHEAAQAPDGDADLDGVDFSGFAVPDCGYCGGMLKPDVVFFGEGIPAARTNAALRMVEEAEALLVVGSSLMVWSGFRLVRLAAERGIPVYAINLGRTRAEALLDARIAADCGSTLENLAAGACDKAAG